MGSADIVTNGLSDDARRRAPNVGRLSRVLSALVLTCALVGCAYQGSSLVEVHYQKYKARMPEGDRVFVCSSYGCRTQTPFRFTAADIAEVKKIMTKGAATPAAER